MRVLIAEDDPISRLMLIATLRKWGYDPLVACDGLEALSYFEQNDPPEIAILDWMMPEMEGPEVCRRVRARFPMLSTYIVLLTAKSQREDLVAGLAAGADDYVTKPFHHQELYARFQVGVRVAGLQRTLNEHVKELGIAMSRLQLMQHSRKLEALGQMSSGIAHEINTPMQYIGDNNHFLQESWSQIQPILERETGNSEISYLLKEVPKAIKESLQGVEKVSKIVRAMRDFSNPAGASKIPVEINRAIETSITVAMSHWRSVANMETEFADGNPMAICFPAEIHQVLFNLIVNAVDAIKDSGKPDNRNGVIRITTSAIHGWIEIRISDTGIGIPEENRPRIFEPFFTTKEVGQGTGLGLATAYSIVVQQHQGQISFETEPGKGTTFLVRLPEDRAGVDRNENEEASSVR